VLTAESLFGTDPFVMYWATTLQGGIKGIVDASAPRVPSADL